MRSGNKLRIAFFNANEIGSGAEDLIHSTIENLIGRACEVRLYVRRLKRSRGQVKKNYVRRIPYFPMELWMERFTRYLSGRNDCVFPSTAFLSRDPWLGSADIWHFHNLHGHFISIPYLAAESQRRRIVLSPVDQFLSTGYCSYTLTCKRHLEACGDCPQINLPYPGISRDATRTLLAMKKASVKKSEFNLLVHTDYLAKHYSSTFVGSLPVERIYYGIDTQVFRPLDRKECATKMGVNPPPRFVVGLFHSFLQEKRKGLLPFLKKLSEFAESRSGRFEALVVGHGSTSARKWATPQLNVRVLPFLQSEHELAYALNACDVLLYPTAAENLSLTCLKSMACGTPVISSDVGGQREAIEDGVNGFLCEPERYDQISERIVQLADDEDMLRRLSLDARRTVVERFDIKMYISNLITYYERLIQTRSVTG